MDSPLRQRIVELANQFADDVIAAISSSLNQHFGRRGAALPPIGRVGGRRTPGELEELSGRILDTVGKHAGGIRAEKLRAELGVSRAALARPVARLLSDGRLKKTGEKRRTTYFLGKNGAGQATGAAKRPRRKVAVKKAAEKKAGAPGTAAPAT